MKITEIRIKKVDGNNKLKAFVSVTFDECFVVHNLKIIDGNKGLFLAMPRRKTKSGEYKDVAHPILTEFRNYLQEEILAKYDADEDEHKEEEKEIENETETETEE